MMRKLSLLFAGALMGASAMSLVYGVPGTAANAAGAEEATASNNISTIRMIVLLI